MDDLKKLRNLWPVFGAVDWQDSGFRWEKAYVCSVLSSLAYAAVPERNQIQTPRYQIIPSELYQRMFVSGNFITDAQVMEFTELGEPVVIWNKHIVTTIRRLGQFLFVAVRGTEIGSLYDWRVNLGSTKDQYSDNTWLHAGFFTETLNHAEEVAIKLDQMWEEGLMVYITGHSMGGAVAAIMNILFLDWGRKYNIHLPSPPYTFGMPRYGDASAITTLPSPYALFHPDDTVPKVPPKRFGFADCTERISVGPLENEKPDPSRIKAVFSNIANIITAKPVREHFIERYRQHIAKELKFDESKFLT